MFDVGIKSAIGGSVYDNEENINEHLNELSDLLKPYANQIDGCVQGNHEWRLYKECGFDLTEQLARTIGIPYMKHTGVVTYAFAKRAYSINFFHGKGGGGIENALRNCKAMSNKVFADIYMMGHVHALAHIPRQIKYVDSRNGKLIEMTQKFVLTGHCLNYDESYADQMNLDINTKGFQTVILHGDTTQKYIEILD